jgi:predicted permease
LEVIRRLIPEFDDIHLELHLDQRGIELAHELVVDQLSADLLEFEFVIVETELDSGRAGALAEFIRLIHCLHPIAHLCFFRKPERGDDHLLQAEFLREGHALIEMRSESREWKMAAFAPKSRGLNLPAHFSGRQSRQRSKSQIFVIRRRAHLDVLIAHSRELAQRSIEVLSDGLPHRPGLASDGQAERGRLELRGTGSGQAGESELSSRDCLHAARISTFTPSSRAAIRLLLSNRSYDILIWVANMSMRKVRAAISRLGGLFGKDRLERDLADEVRSHLELHIEDNLRSGMTPEEARRQALIKLGGIQPAKEIYRDQRGFPMLETTLQDLRYGLRALRKNLAFTGVAVVTLALGVGANTAIFSVVKAVLLNQLPYRQPGRLVALGEDDSGDKRPETIGYATAYDWRRLNHSFESMSLYRDATAAIVERGEPELLSGLRVNYDFFDTLGVPMQIGRTFLPEEDRPDRRYEIILSNGLWMRRFGGDPNVIGRVIRLNESSFTVVGVLPAGFRTLEIPGAPGYPEMFQPLGYDLSQPFACRDCQHLHLIARIKAGVTAGQAHAELKTIMANLVRQYPASYPSSATAAFMPLQTYLVGRVSAALWVLLGAVGLVLLIACANVANLMLARATRRAKEIALRAALGAGRGRLIRQLITESLVLALAGGLAGILLAWTGTSMLASLGPKEIPRVNEIRMDAAVLLFGLAASIVTGLLFGLTPALRSSRVDLNDALKDLGKSTESRSRFGLRNVLVAAELAIAFVLVVGAGLLARSFLNLMNVDAGYDPHNVITLGTFAYGARYQKPEVELAYDKQAMDRFRQTPGVESVAMASNLPLLSFDRYGFHIRERSTNPSEDPSVDTYSISPDYLRVMKIPLQRGRMFTDQDGPSSPKVALISENCARKMFPNADPIGKQIQLGGRDDKQPWSTIVGVVGDVRQYGLDKAPDMAAYIAQAQNMSFLFSMVARTSIDPRNLEAAARAAFHAADPTLPVFRVRPLESYVASSLAQRRFTLVLLSLFGGLALALAAVGIYGLISYAVTLRTREVGIRMAFGAERSDVLKMVLRQGLVLIGAGLAVGFAASVALTRLLTTLLFEVGATDLATTAAVAVLLAAVALLASYLPARRAASVDPMIALRYE